MMTYAQDKPYVNWEISELSETERIIANFFADEEKVAKLIKFLSLEENKDSDQGCNSIENWNLRFELGHKLRQGLRTRLGRRWIGRRLRLGLRRRLRLSLIVY